MFWIMTSLDESSQKNNMKIKILLGSALLLGLGFYFYPRGQKPRVAQVPKKSAPSSRKLFLGSRKTTPPQTVFIKSDSLEGCEELTLQLAEVDLTVPVRDWVEAFEKKALVGCDLPEFADEVRLLREHCFEKLTDESCTQQAIFLRAGLRTRGLTDAEDREMLADLILREFKGKSGPDFARLKKFSNKLLELDPSQPAIQKLWVTSAVVDKLMSGKSPTEAAKDISDRLDEKIWLEPEMQGIRLAVATGMKPQGVEDYARGYLSKKEDPLMHEMLGWALWKQNRQAEAIEQLEQAIALSPKDPWLQNQLKVLKEKGSNPDSYQTRISLGINLGDLY